MRDLSVIGRAIAVLLLFLPGTPLIAQTVYKYRDANGQWVFTDQARSSAESDQTITFGHENSKLHVSVDRSDDAEHTQLIAANDCLCVATFQVSVVDSAFADIANGSTYRATLAPGTRQVLARAARAGVDDAKLRFVWKAALGSPDTVHNPTVPYRAPFGVGSTFLISQAFPDRITHTTADSQYAVDIALPDGTPVYAAREGVVINTRHDSFRGAPAPVMLDQANFIEVLHSDGTIAIYGHLHWDSIRVRMGQRVVRGEYLANSGNTGFTSGPHLHFAVVKNTGFEDVSVPVQFAGVAGVAVSPVSRMPLTAY